MEERSTRVKDKDHYYPERLKIELETNYLNSLLDLRSGKKFEACDLLIVYHPMIILSFIISEKSSYQNISVGIASFVIYLTIQLLLKKQKNRFFRIILEVIKVIIQVIMSINALGLYQLLIESTKSRQIAFLLQVTFHGYSTLALSSHTDWVGQEKIIFIKHFLLEVVQIIFFSLSENYKYQQIEYTNINAVIDAIVVLSFTLANYLIYVQTKQRLSSFRRLSYQSDLNHLKFKKLEYFLANLDNSNIVLVRQDPSLEQETNIGLSNDLLNRSPAMIARVEDMKNTFENIKQYQVEEKGKKLQDVLANKSMGDEWDQPHMYWFQINKQYQESLEAKFLGFLDWRLDSEDEGENELNCSHHYYAIQVISNSGLLRKINEKHQCLSHFIKIVKEQLSKNFHYNVTDLNKIVDLCDDLCYIIHKEVQLYQRFTYPKDFNLFSPSNLQISILNKQMQSSPLNPPDYSISQVQNNMSLFFKLYQQNRNTLGPKLEFGEPPQGALKLTKEIYFSVIHLIINAIMNFLKQAECFKISFSGKQIFHIKIKCLDETRVLGGANDCFENSVYKIHQFEYHKEQQGSSLLYSFDFSDIKSQQQQQQQQQQLKQAPPASGTNSQHQQIQLDPIIFQQNNSNDNAYGNNTKPISLQLLDPNQLLGGSFKQDKDKTNTQFISRHPTKELTFNQKYNNNEYTFDHLSNKQKQ